MSRWLKEWNKAGEKKWRYRANSRYASHEIYKLLDSRSGSCSAALDQAFRWFHTVQMPTVRPLARPRTTTKINLCLRETSHPFRIQP